MHSWCYLYRENCLDFKQTLLPFEYLVTFHILLLEDLNLCFNFVVNTPPWVLCVPSTSTTMFKLYTRETHKDVSNEDDRRQKTEVDHKEYLF